MYQFAVSRISYSIAIAVLLLASHNHRGLGQDHMQRSDKVASYPIFRRGLWGYANREGHIVVAPIFRRAQAFFEGRAAVELPSRKSGYIRQDGTWAVELPRDAIATRRYAEGRAWFPQLIDGNFRYGCVDQDGTLIVSPRFDLVAEFSESRAAVMSTQHDHNGLGEDRYGYVDQNGHVVIPLKYLSAGDFGNQLAPVMLPGKRIVEFIDKAGDVVISPKWLAPSPTSIVTSMGFSDGRAAFVAFGPEQMRPRQGLINTMGEVVWETQELEWIGKFSCGLTRVRAADTKLYGFIDRAGRYVIPPKYRKAGDFQEGLCRVCVNEAWEYIDSTGEVSLRGLSDQHWNDAEDFCDGLARVHIGGIFHDEEPSGPHWWEGGTWYYIDRDGVTVMVCRKDGDEYLGVSFGRELGHPVNDE